MSPHHSDQMSGRSEVNWIVFCMTFSKVLSQSVSESVTRSPIELLWTAKNTETMTKTKTHTTKTPFENLRF